MQKSVDVAKMLSSLNSAKFSYPTLKIQKIKASYLAKVASTCQTTS